jgi:peroxiredoxin Q/BCP
VGAQAAPAAALTPLKVGEMAPDFTVTVVTAAGVAAKPFKLSEHKGETVVLAFFPKARTRGCTVQMESYRDQYAQTFQGGKKVTLVGVSIDSDTALISWATDAKFPFHFAADTDRKVGVAYGANGGTGFHKRTLYVIDPTGKISYVTASFNQMSADAYTELGNAIVHAGNSH